ncbi:MAG: zinc ribbon domain-containing protein [Clostridiales bacterium]|nr:zinc ribbon domain-containing protein [Clostridiales bacterium]
MAIFDPKQKVIAGYQKSIDDKKNSIKKYYDEIGRMYYGQYKDMNLDVTKDINTRCDAVSTLYDEIDDLNIKILHEKGLKLCPKCRTENALTYAFCFKCGSRFDDPDAVIDESAIAGAPAPEPVPAVVPEPIIVEEPMAQAEETEAAPAEEAPSEDAEA